MTSGKIIWLGFIGWGILMWFCGYFVGKGRDVLRDTWRRIRGRVLGGR